MSKSCLYVAPGVTALRAPEFCDFGDVVTINAAVSLFDHVDIACLTSPSKITLLERYLRKAGRIVGLFHQSSLAAATPHELVLKMLFLQFDRTRAPNMRRQYARQFVRQGGLEQKSTYGLQSLYLLGYRRFWLFGHDGGTSYIPGWQSSADGYNLGRDCTEAWCERVAAEHGVEYWFWPQRPSS